MLYSFLSQINKGLRRIDILRSPQIAGSQQGFEQSFRADNFWFTVYMANSTGNEK
jgi:hypothetical protein